MCGDSLYVTSESCDDGNVVDGDGCAFNCTIELGYQCTKQIGSTSVCFLPVDPVIGFSTTSFGPFAEGQFANMTVTRLGNNQTAVSVSYRTVDSTATHAATENNMHAPGAAAGGTAHAIAGDYTSVNGTLSFAIGEVSKTISVEVLADGAYDGATNEKIAAVLSNPNGADLMDGFETAYIAIRDDDSPPSATPTMAPSGMPTVMPSSAPSQAPTRAPTASPSPPPTVSPVPSAMPSPVPSVSPFPTTSPAPTPSPSLPPTSAPSPFPSLSPTSIPTPTPPRGSKAWHWTTLDTEIVVGSGVLLVCVVAVGFACAPALHRKLTKGCTRLWVGEAKQSEEMVQETEMIDSPMQIVTPAPRDEDNPLRIAWQPRWNNL